MIKQTNSIIEKNILSKYKHIKMKLNCTCNRKYNQKYRYQNQNKKFNLPIQIHAFYLNLKFIKFLKLLFTTKLK